MEVGTRVGSGMGQERVWECRGRVLARAQAIYSGHEQGGRFAIADGGDVHCQVILLSQL